LRDTGRELIDLLRETPSFASLDAGDLEALAAAFRVVRVPGGTTVMREGGPADELHLVVRGRLRVTKSAGGARVELAELGRGEVIGEMALLTEGERTATVTAVRDSLLAALSGEEFARLVERRPAVLVNLARIVVRRLAGGQRRGPASENLSIAVASAGDGRHHAAFAAALAADLSRHGPALHVSRASVEERFGSAALAGPSAGDDLLEWLSAQEAAHRYIVYECDEEASPWSRLCLRQSDRVVFVAAAAGRVALGPVEQALSEFSADAAPAADLVLLHAAATRCPEDTKRWLAERRLRGHHHAREGDSRDVQRIARLLVNRGVGLALGGGGARGFAHIGVIRAMTERGIPIDTVGGTSAGACLGAMCAMGLDWREMIERCREGFVKHPPGGDYTFPFVSLSAGGRFHRTLERVFGDLEIEDLWLPFFCVTTNLTRATSVARRSGLVRQWVRASGGLPGAIPPVFHDGEVYVDGCVLNNLPADVVRAQCGGTVIAVDVDQNYDMSTDLSFQESVSGWRLLANRVNPFGTKRRVPNIMRILHRTAHLGTAQAGERIRLEVDLYLHPPVEKYGVFDMHALPEIAESGYQYAAREIDAWLSAGGAARLGL